MKGSPTPRPPVCLLALAFLVAVGGSACSDDQGTNGGSGLFEPTNDAGDSSDGDASGGAIRLFSSDIDTVVVEVDYAEGAAPFTSNLTTRYWDMFRVNAEKLFEISQPELQIPDSLDEMENIGAVAPGPYDTSALLSLADQYRDTSSAGSTASFYILFVDGYYRKDGEANENVIGVSIGRTGVIAIFKPVIARLGATEYSQAMGEQATLVHEFGHAVGLVANPVPTISDHHDTEHGAHCSNTDCVMYWLNERPSELATFLEGLLTGGTNRVLFDDQCIEDIRAVSGP